MAYEHVALFGEPP